MSRWPEWAMRRSLPGLAALLLVLLLAACAATDEREPAASDMGAAGDERRTTLLFWHAWPSPEQHILARLVERYNQTHTDTQIILQAMPLSSITDELRTAALVGSGPHMVLLQSHTIGPLAEDGLLLPLDETLVGTDERERLLTTAVEAAVVQHDSTAQLYGLPLSFNTLVLYYHTGAFETLPETTDMLLNSAHTAASADEQTPVWGMAYTLSIDKTMAYLPAFGGQVLNAEGEVVLGSEGRAGTERWLQWLLDLQQDSRILARSDSIAVDSALKAQEAFMTFDWTYALSGYRALWGDHLGVAPLPNLSATGEAARPYVQSDVLSINAQITDEVQQEAALDFMRYLLSEDAQQALLEVGRQPVLRSVDLAGDTLELQAARAFRQQAQQGQPMPNSQQANTLVREELARMQLLVLRGLDTPANAVTLTDAVLRERLQATPTP